MATTHGRRKHGHATNGTKSRVYTAWHNMMNRCSNQNAQNYHRYGGRGITVCDRWLTFQNFLDDMGEPPPGKSLERKNNDLGYSPENCCWASRDEQYRNRVNNVWIDTCRGKMILKDAAKLAGIDPKSMARRVKSGLKGDALFAPSRKPRLIQTRFGMLTVGQIAKISGVDRGTINSRIATGWAGDSLFIKATLGQRHTDAPQPAAT